MTYLYINKKNNFGFLAIPAILITSILLLIGIYFLNFSIDEKKISESYSLSEQAYYLAESGLEYAIFKLKNDETWKTNFETDPNWQIATTCASVLFPNGSYEISIKNYALAHANIIATSTLTVGDRTSQRVLKSNLFKALGDGAIGNSSMLSDGDIEISASTVNITNGSIFSNDAIEVKNFSTLNVQDAIKAVDAVEKDEGSVINANVIYDENNPPAPESIPMPAVSLQQMSDPDSLKAKAEALGQVYSSDQFRNLLDANPNLVLDGYVFVNGIINIEAGEHLTINGVLGSTGQMNIGENGTCTGDDASITVNHTNGDMAGIFCNNKISFLPCVNDIAINGVIYAGHQVNLTDLNSNFNLTGSIISRDISFSNLSNEVNLNFDPIIVADNFGGTPFAPIITVEYWEEEY